ncbi:MAG: T9SS type A sorting domain-containing protein [Ignavibacteria bacterium]|nr:T9SS type A sorting domain-containing protein [Ignavibacteria bacterium]
MKPESKKIYKPERYLMKIILFFVVFVTFLTINCLGQSITWMKSYGWAGTDVANAIIQTPDNGYLVTGRSLIGMRVLRLDPYGDTIWNRVFPGTEGKKITRSADNNYVVLGQYASLTKFDINGNMIWTSGRYNNDAITADFIQLPDGGFLLCGAKDTLGILFKPHLIRVNSNGVLQWEKTYTQGIFDGVLKCLRQTSDNAVVYTGNYSNTDTITDELFIMKTDLQGELLFFYGYDTLRYYHGIEFIDETPEGSFIVGGGRPFMAKISPTGIIESYKNYYSNGSIMSFHGFSKTNDGGYIVTGAWDTAGNSQVFAVLILKVNSKLNEIFRRVYLYAENEDDDGTSIVQTLDSGYAISGRRGNEVLLDFLILKTDTYGNINTVGITPINNSIPTSYELHQNYPNPFNPSTNIKFDIIKAGLVRVIIYDLLGREVERLVNQEMIPGSYKVDFSAVNYASGLYFYRIESGEFVDIKKMLIVK